MQRLAVLALLVASATASANGRRPLTNGVQFQPGDDHSIYVRTTFGLLVSHDDGCTFNWICESAVGYGAAFDPKYAIAKTGTIFATTLGGLQASYDGGCSFKRVTSPVWVDALDIASDGTIWIGTSEAGGVNDIFTSIDDGYTFQPKFLESPTVRYKSLVVAKGDPQRVYASGITGDPDPKTTHLYRTIDGGGAWTELSLASVTLGVIPEVHVLAVDPANADTVFVASIGAGTDTGDILYRSTDRGDTLSPVLTTSMPIVGLVIDGSHVIVATSTAQQATPSPAFESTDGGQTFASMASAPQLGCIGQRDDGKLFGCGENWDPDFKAVALSSDGSSWSKVFRFVELAGPLQCPAGTAENDLCVPGWPMVQQQFATTGPTCGANVQPDAGVEPDHDGQQMQPTPPGGCCDAGSGGPTALVGALGVMLVLRRRRA